MNSKIFRRILSMTFVVRAKATSNHVAPVNQCRSRFGFISPTASSLPARTCKSFVPSSCTCCSDRARGSEVFACCNSAQERPRPTKWLDPQVERCRASVLNGKSRSTAQPIGTSSRPSTPTNQSSTTVEPRSSILAMQKELPDPLAITGDHDLKGDRDGRQDARGTNQWSVRADHVT